MSNILTVTVHNTSEMTAKPTTPSFVHYGAGITLTCTLKVAAESELTDVEFYQGSTLLSSGVDKQAYGSSLKTVVYTKVAGSVLKTDGDTYKCVYKFGIGDNIEASIDVRIHRK